MSPERIRGLYRTVDASNWIELRSFFHLDIVYERPGYAPFVGIEELIRFYRDERIIAAGEHHLECIVVDGRNGACWGRFIGKKKDGCEIDESFIDVYGFECGKIKSRKSFFFRPAI